MKKWIYLSFLLVVGVISCRKVDNKVQNLEADSTTHIETQQTQLEATQDAEAEQNRLDSIRQDSIQRESNRQDSLALEDKMRLKPSVFRDAWWDEKKLKSLGFKKIKEKETPYEDDGLSLYEVTYTRTYNGRRIDVEGVAESCHGVDIIFYDNRDKDFFIKELKKADKGNTGFVEKYYFEYNIKGKKIEISGCG